MAAILSWSQCVILFTNNVHYVAIAKWMSVTTYWFIRLYWLSFFCAIYTTTIKCCSTWSHYILSWIHCDAMTWERCSHNWRTSHWWFALTKGQYCETPFYLIDFDSFYDLVSCFSFIDGLSDVYFMYVTLVSGVIYMKYTSLSNILI